ncbi:hypothetical protein [Belnapia moabensis]|uniref:hypothetical protein n=1 Tax=Belnapia moabensis TaxID=365533 RepID=UPI0012EEA375|nr:hypothetical protein [Belnapia moabensis]
MRMDDHGEITHSQHEPASYTQVAFADPGTWIATGSLADAGCDPSINHHNQTPAYICPAQVGAPASEGIIHNDKADEDKDDGWHHVSNSRPVRWKTRPRSPQAHALVKRITEAVRATYRRAPKAGVDLEGTAAGFVGSLFVNAMQGRWSSHPTNPNAFTATGISYRVFTKVREAMETQGWIEVKPGFARLVAGWREDGGAGVLDYEATRFRPTSRLLAMAEADYGIRACRALAHFQPERLDIAEADLVQWRRPSRVATDLHGKRVRIGGERVEIDPDSLSDMDRRHLAWLRSKVVMMNRVADQHRITHGPADDPVTLRPEWYRVFTYGHGFDLHGRWYAAGGDYQSLKRRDREWGRPSLRIDGEPLAEVDARASQLCLLAGIAGESLDPGADPYALQGFDRAVVKAYIAATIGNGGPPCVWTRKAWKDAAEAGVTLPRSVRDVRAAVLGRYPFLARLPELLGCPGEPRLCGHVLMGVESRALTIAMLRMADQGILALPLHDALLVRVSHAEEAKEALECAYEAAGDGARVRVRVKPMLGLDDDDRGRPGMRGAHAHDHHYQSGHKGPAAVRQRPRPHP